MKNLKTIFAITAICLVGILTIYLPSFSQKKSVTQWEYCAITFTGIDAQNTNQGSVVGIANICYVETTVCKNEFVKSEITYSKFLQDYSLNQNKETLSLANNYAEDSAFSKTVAKLGSDGWEMISEPTFQFNDYSLNVEGRYVITPQEKNNKPNIYFKRIKP